MDDNAQDATKTKINGQAAAAASVATAHYYNRPLFFPFHRRLLEFNDSVGVATILLRRRPPLGHHRIPWQPLNEVHSGRWVVFLFVLELVVLPSMSLSAPRVAACMSVAISAESDGQGHMTGNTNGRRDSRG